jgi:hypothetical protein
MASAAALAAINSRIRTQTEKKKKEHELSMKHYESNTSFTHIQKHRLLVSLSSDPQTRFLGNILDGICKNSSVHLYPFFL